MSQLKKHQVVMLPTENKKEAPLYITDDNILLLNIQPNQNKTVSNIIFTDCKYQHLYFISNEEIKEGDWYIHNQKPNGLRVSNSSAIPMDAKKITATTNQDLK